MHSARRRPSARCRVVLFVAFDDLGCASCAAPHGQPVVWGCTCAPRITASSSRATSSSARIASRASCAAARTAGWRLTGMCARLPTGATPTARPERAPIIARCVSRFSWRRAAASCSRSRTKPARSAAAAASAASRKPDLESVPTAYDDTTGTECVGRRCVRAAALELRSTAEGDLKNATCGEGRCRGRYGGRYGGVADGRTGLLAAFGGLANFHSQPPVLIFRLRRNRADALHVRRCDCACA